MDVNEEVICKIECDPKRNGKVSRGDSVVITQKRLYKTGINGTGQVMQKVVSMDRVSAVTYGKERNLWFLFIGVVFAALCCLLSAYFLPGDKLMRFVLGLIALGVGAAVLILCLVAFFRFSVGTVTILFDGGKIRVASAGLTDEEAKDFAERVLDVAEKARSLLKKAE
ncbi:MAG: hypothetical protein K2M95_01380 [Clostridiales bacterium]|nr:hypothetical protein [Clostridiales bacterium]